MKATSRLTALVFVALIVCIPPASGEDSSSLSDVLSSLKSQAAAPGDSKLASLGDELKGKANALGSSLSGNPDAQSSLKSALQSLTSGKSADSLGGLQKLTAAKLTPEQSKLAGDLFHVGSAYVVQKDFGSIEGAQGDVAQAVKALRKGDTVSAVPALQNIARNAKLTEPQKNLITSMAKQYAPGGDAVGKALDSLGNLPGYGK